MKLLTLNCHSWQEEKQLDKIKILAETIKEKDYDVIALQEVSQSIKSEIVFHNMKQDNYLLILINELKKLGVNNYNYVWDFAHIGFDIYEEGLAILTKHKIAKVHSFFISKSKDTCYWKTRKIVGFDIIYKHKKISFFSCHLGWWNDSEEPFVYQADNLLGYINNQNIVFLMGDFNNDANRRNEGYDYLLKKNLYDSYTLAQRKDNGSTIVKEISGWNKNKENLRIDYIFTYKRCKVNYSETIFNGYNKPIISDHYGIEVEVYEP